VVFAHNAFTVQFLFDRLPLYIVALYPAVVTLAFQVVRIDDRSQARCNPPGTLARRSARCRGRSILRDSLEDDPGLDSVGGALKGHGSSRGLNQGPRENQL